MDIRTEELVRSNCPQLYNLIKLSKGKWRKFDKSLKRRELTIGRSNDLIIIANIYDLIEASKQNNPKARAILEYAEEIASDLNLNLSSNLKAGLSGNASQLFDPAPDGKQIFFERLSELRSIQQFAVQKGSVTVEGLDVKIESSGKDVDLVITHDEIKFHLEFVSIRLDPERIQSQRGLSEFLYAKVTQKRETKFSDGVPTKGPTMIIPTLLTNAKMLAPYRTVFQIDPNRPFAGVVPFFYLAVSVPITSGGYLWRIEEASGALERLLT